MEITTFSAFYPSTPVWAVEQPDLRAQRADGWHHDLLSEIVYRKESEYHMLQICRDGRIELHVRELEKNQPDLQDPSFFADQQDRWTSCLDHLNAFYILLDSAILSEQKISFLNLHEITSRDAFRVKYNNKMFLGENSALDGNGRIFQERRFAIDLPNGIPNEMNPKWMRSVVSESAITQACNQFSTLITQPSSIPKLAMLTKSLGQYKMRSYPTSIVLSWFVTEALLNSMDANQQFGTIHQKIDDLKNKQILDLAICERITSMRRLRNKITHSSTAKVNHADAQNGIEIAKTLFCEIWNVRFEPNFCIIGAPW